MCAASSSAWNPRTRRVHTTFDQTGSVTGRLSSLDPNLQNIPIRTEAGRRIRRAFIAPKGKVLVSADYSQIDLRVLAHESQDATLMESFEKGEDIHLRTAAEIFHIKPEDDHGRPAPRGQGHQLRHRVRPDRLRPVQPTRHLPAGSLGLHQELPRALSRRVGLGGRPTSPRPKVDGCVRTLLGRVRWLPDLAAKNVAVRQFTERAARNTPIQGGSADIIKLAMLDIAKG